jgi:hypothetical protein
MEGLLFISLVACFELRDLVMLMGLTLEEFENKKIYKTIISLIF